MSVPCRMKFLLDQNLSPKTTAFLRNKGHEVIDAREAKLCNTPDSILMETASKEQSILVSFDLDFSDIREIRTFKPVAVIVFRTRSFSSATVNRLFDHFLGQFQEDRITGNIFIISEAHIRWRSIE